jgi:two-component system response regulator HydG
LGAFHFITKPILDFDAVTLTLLRAAHFSRLQRRARSLEQRIGLEQRFEKMVGNSPAMRALYLRMSKVAETDLSVLIQGESGTGKELVARGIHDRSKRARAPFVGVNCSAIPEALIDSELFGHTKGAFTGAAEARAGVFVEAHDGTLLLDEVGELSPAVQSRLLRVLQEHEVRPLGASGTRQVDVRVIAASHVDLDELVKAKLFRAVLSAQRRRGPHPSASSANRGHPAARDPPRQQTRCPHEAGCPAPFPGVAAGAHAISLAW